MQVAAFTVLHLAFSIISKLNGIAGEVFIFVYFIFSVAFVKCALVLLRSAEYSLLCNG